MSKALELAKFGRETPPTGVVVGDTDLQTLSQKTFADGPVFSSGAVNAVPYLNASKVFSTSGTFVFDGTNLGIGTANPAYMLQVKGGALGVTSADGTVTSIINYNSLGTVTNSDFVFNTNSIERARISSAGLQVTGALSVTTGVTAGATSGYTAGNIFVYDASGIARIGSNAGSTLRLFSNGVNAVDFNNAGTPTFNAGVAVTGTLSTTGHFLGSHYFNSTDVSGMYVSSIANNHYVNSALIGSFSSSGLQVTGAITATTTSTAAITARSTTYGIKVFYDDGRTTFTAVNYDGISTVGAQDLFITSGQKITFGVNSAGTISYPLEIATSGNVGIGTAANADYRLTVARGNESTGQVGLANFRTEATGSATYNAGVQIFGTASATAANRLVSFVMDADGADAAGGNYFYIGKVGGDGRVDLIQASNAPMGFAAGYVNRGVIDMTLSAAGNLGLGTTPNTGAKFQVTGFTDFWNTTNTLLRVQHDGSRGKLQSYTGGAVGNIALNPDGGNVGIGTNDPGAKLEVASSGTNSLLFIPGSVPELKSGGSNTDLRLSAVGPGGWLALRTDGTDRLYIGSNGNVGIGTGAAPTVKFQTVQTIADWTGDFKNYTAGAYGLRVDLSGSSGNQAALQVYTAAGNGLIVQNNGAVGIGTFNPTVKLEVNGEIKSAGIDINQNNNLLYFTKTAGSTGTSSNNTHFIGRVDSAGYHVVTDGGTGFASIVDSFVVGAKGSLILATSTPTSTYSSGRVIINQTGDVGIGTRDPTEKLHVQGIANGNGAHGPRINLQYSGTSGNAESLVRFLDFRGNANAAIGNSLQDDGVSTAAAHLVFKTAHGGTLYERMRINRYGYVTKPYQPAWCLRPNSGGTAEAGNSIIGWTSNTSGTSGKATFLNGVTLTGSGSGIHNATSTGRLTVPVAGKYKIWVTIRGENFPNNGNIYLDVNGSNIARQHVEVWGPTSGYPYGHGFLSMILDLSANDFIEIRVACAGLSVSGFNDTVNWFSGELIG